ncbi:hypothetical protein NQ317_013358 [Molorchus minor]|uniref:Copper homeostasis protein cutC homolog n=1 Tax=Molorchus minor TaxID=1323400 RepID=A0ABQ9JNU8_9CUCU|nr:hypothetical protein NQ317_013358 [Molorchus minor]
MAHVYARPHHMLQTEEEVLDIVGDDPSTSTREIARQAQIFDLKKQEAEQQNKLRQQYNMYEAMRTDRNALQKAFQESSAEGDELKKKLKMAYHQTEQLKEDIVMKEKLLVKDENVMRKLTKEKENLKIELMAGLDLIKNLKIEIRELKEEEKRLHKTIMVNDRTIRDQAKTIDQLMNERDVLGSQLVRRNDEISLLNEKIVILQTTMARGEAHYDQRLNDIKLLKLEVRRLRQEKNIMSKSITNTIDLRQEIFHLQRELTQSRLQCKALEQEMQNPLNIHRWRKLEGSDPEVLDLLQKVQILQKRLLQQASDAVERERQLKEAERLYMNLKQVLSKQPGPGIQEELSKTQRALKLRGDKLKSLVSELNMAELKSTEYKSDLQRVTDELAELKRKYLSEKKANRNMRMAAESSRELNLSRGGRGDASEVKFTGGGFRIPVAKAHQVPKMSKVLEVCVDSVESAVAALNGGADRLELCSSLIEGGLTPTPGMLIQIQNMNIRKIPVFCLRKSKLCKKMQKILRKNGADGFVFGALSDNGEVDMKICREIIRASHPLPVTFHRAFDFCKRPTIEIEVIIDLGFQRILTSGKQKTAQMGVKLITKLMEQVGDRIIIMPGGGINKDNLKFIMDHTEATEIHGSFKVIKEELDSKTEDESDEPVMETRKGPLYVTDEAAVAEIVNILRTL